MRRNYGPTYVAPLVLWLAFFFLVPLVLIVLFSFLAKGVYGGVLWRFSLAAYRSLAHTAYVQIAMTTFFIAAASTVIILIVALPASYYIARSRHGKTLLFLVMIPFWTNFLVRIYAWIAILGNNGFLNQLLQALGLIRGHVQFLYNQWAVIVVTVYTYLPFAMLPLYAAIERFDFSLLEAARDLGATRRQAVVRVFLPNISAGVLTAVLLTFIPAFGSYAIPQIIGGRGAMMLGTVIARELTVTRNWPLSCAISVVLTVLTAAAVALLMRIQTRADKRSTPLPTMSGEGT